VACLRVFCGCKLELALPEKWPYKLFSVQSLYGEHRGLYREEVDYQTFPQSRLNSELILFVLFVALFEHACGDLFEEFGADGAGDVKRIHPWIELDDIRTHDLTLQPLNQIDRLPRR
jgi:hypothetical protein